MNITTFLNIALRYTARHRLQTFLLVLGIALGVAVIVAVDLANTSAGRAFRLSIESVTGRATHQIVGGPSGVPEELYHRLRVGIGVRECAPVVAGYVTAVEFYRPLRLLGVDPFAESPFRSYLADRQKPLPKGTLTTLLTEPHTVLMSEELAHNAGFGVGSTLTLECGSRKVTARIAGLLKPKDEISRRALSGMLISDIASAQEMLEQTGRLSHIDLILDPGTPQGKAALEQIRAALPPGTQIILPESKTAAVAQMTRSFEMNLLAFSFLALLVGVFLIYNTVTFSVVERRPILGILRALGVTRREIFAAVLGETVLLGAVGALVGVALGVVLGKGAVRFVTQTINDLYFTLTITEFTVSVVSLGKGILVGILAAAMAAVVPACEASFVAPAGVLCRSNLESRAVRLIPRLSVAGILTIGLGVLLFSLPVHGVYLGFAGLFAVVTGSALLVPLFTSVLMRFTLPFTTKLGVLGQMAPRSVVRSLSRTAIAIAALMIAISVMLGISLMVGSFRSTVVNWLEDTINADIFISRPSRGMTHSQGFDRSVSEEVRNFPGVQRVEFGRILEIPTPKYGVILLRAITGDIARRRRFLWSDGKVENLRQKLSEGAVVVSQPFAYHNSILPGPGATVELPTDQGTHRFPVAGIFYDYASDRGIVFVAESFYRKLWNDRQISSVVAYVEPGSDVDKVIDGLRRHFAGRYHLIIQSYQSVREEALTIFDRTFTIAAALHILAGMVAFISIFSTLMSLQLERVQEIGVLRATGMTTAQISRMILMETGFMGMAAGLFSLPLGTGMSLILIYVINLRSFGWTLEFLPQPHYYLQAFAVAVLAALLAGIYPALRFARLQVAAALRRE